MIFLKQNVIYFNENKQKFIDYYRMVKESKKKINNLDELNLLILEAEKVLKKKYKCKLKNK